MSKFGPKYEQNTQKMAVFCYRRIGRNGRIFGTEYSAGFGRIFRRIFGIRSYTSLHLGSLHPRIFYFPLFNEWIILYSKLNKHLLYKFKKEHNRKIPY